MYQLHIANKNYSSWSLRPWVLMVSQGIAFEEHMAPFTPEGDASHFLRFSPTGKVPCLTVEDHTLWESLAIVEFLAERHKGVWPGDTWARAWARCASAEMHAGFTHLREMCSMNCGLRVHLHAYPDTLQRDVKRLDALWQEGLREFAGPFLAGAHFSAVDAFFAPMVFRVQTYDLPLSERSQAYIHEMLQQPAMQRWYGEALQEKNRIRSYEAHALEVGSVWRDERVPITH